jgi:hypothetical protein
MINRPIIVPRINVGQRGPAGSATGPGSSVINDLVIFADTSGQNMSDSGILLSDVVLKTATQTLTNKTITKPKINADIKGVQSYSPSAAGTATLDCSLSNIHKITMPAGNITIALSNISIGQIIKIDITQDATGSRIVTWFTTIRWAGGLEPTLTTTANKRDSIGIECTGSGTYDGYVIGQGI